MSFDLNDSGLDAALQVNDSMTDRLSVGLDLTDSFGGSPSPRRGAVRMAHRNRGNKTKGKNDSVLSRHRVRASNHTKSSLHNSKSKSMMDVYYTYICVSVCERQIVRHLTDSTWCRINGFLNS